MSRSDIRATYRVQLHAGFGFEHAAALAGYLSELGVSHLYCSPFLQAAPGSTHGYDVVDHSRLSDELGGAEGLERLHEALAARGMSHILDLVPNHMAAYPEHNARWWDVLKQGPASRYARFFDIDWDPPDHELKGKVLLPVLGAPLDEVLDARELGIDRRGDEPVLRYYGHIFPLAPGSLEGVGDSPADPATLRALLAAQHHLPAFWRDAFTRLNYRRFFAINELVALRMEEKGTFEEVHELVLRLLRDGKLDGLRVDHVDGLAGPRPYLERLRAESGDGAYIVVEKILAPDERLVAEWPVEGTTGYDFLNVVSGLFVDPSSEDAFTDLYACFTGEPTDLAALHRDKKLQLMRTELFPDLTRLAVSLSEVSGSAGTPQDVGTCRELLEEVVAGFDVYRTYVEERASKADTGRARAALRKAKVRRPDLPGELYALLEEALLDPDRHGHAGREFAVRLQQTTGPVTAKGVEDTLFYTYNRFAALNEVGGDPGRFGVSIDEFHDFCAGIQNSHPLSMLTTSTHDTKRSEDVRARLAVLSEIPEAWAAAVARWSQMNERHRTDGLPDRNAEYLLYQTLVGAWPLEAERAVAYMEKASKEAKSHTSWIDPSPAYDAALRMFVESVCSDHAFVSDLQRFVAPLVEPGRTNSLAQTLIKLTAPGVPDLYQGTELWDLTLVDPDNRRPVDYALRCEVLRDTQNAAPEDISARADTGAPKLFVVARAVQLRRDRAQAFGRTSSYRPLRAEGPRAGHVVAFARAEEVVTIVPRLVLGLGGDWRGTSVGLTEGIWHNALTSERLQGGPVALADLLRRFPVAVLVRS